MQFKRLKCLFVLLFILVMGLGIKSYSQGCSDAGVCSTGSLYLVTFNYQELPKEVKTLKLLTEEDLDLKIIDGDSVVVTNKTPITPTNTTISSRADSTVRVNSMLEYRFIKHLIRYTSHCGIGDRGTVILTNQLEENIRFSEKLTGQIKLPYTLINGNLANVSGLGDITLALSYYAFNKRNSNLSFTGGVKLPSNNANKSMNGHSLPMVYQTSLGSTDFLAGAKYSYNKWDLTVGYQHSFSTTKNGYLHQPISANDMYNDYFESNKIKRSDDVIVRLYRGIDIKKHHVGMGLLWIYHLADDRMTNSLGDRVSIAESKGTTLNLNIAGIVSISQHIDISLVAASPVIIRKARPDGLTRSFVGILGVSYKIFKK